MMWTEELFGVKKPIIALLHLRALPGDPDFCGDINQVIRQARRSSRFSGLQSRRCPDRE